MANFPKPRKWKPTNVDKYIGDHTNIVSRSSWETKTFNWCDTSSSIIRWNSEDVKIPYISPIDGKRHMYHVDLYLEVRQVDGSTKRYLAEIKPDKQTRPPEVPQKKTKQFINEAMTYAINEAKWKAATEVCKDNGLEFIILTEKHIFGK